MAKQFGIIFACLLAGELIAMIPGVSTRKYNRHARSYSSFGAKSGETGFYSSALSLSDKEHGFFLCAAGSGSYALFRYNCCGVDTHNGGNSSEYLPCDSGYRTASPVHAQTD